MNVKQLNEIIKEVKEDLGDALLSTDIWAAADGQIIAGTTPQPKEGGRPHESDGQTHQ